MIVSPLSPSGSFSLQHRGLNNEETPSFSQRITQAAKRSIDSVRSSWVYVGKSISLTKHSIKVYLNASGAKCGKCLLIIRRLSHASIIGACLTLKSLKGNITSIDNSRRVRDIDGVAMGSLAFITNIGDFFDGIGTFAGSFLDLIDSAPVIFYKKISFSLGMGICTIAMINTTFKSVKMGMFAGKIEKVLKSCDSENNSDSDLVGNLKEFVSQLDSLPGKELILDRYCGAEMKGKVLELESLLKKEEVLNREQINKSIQDLRLVKEHVRREIKFNIVSIFCNIVTIIGLSLFLVASVPAFVPFIAFSLSVMIRLLVALNKERLFHG